MNTLHITNGDATVDLLQAAGITGDYLPWRDVLHMGPVPLCESLETLSEIRADFIASLSWGEPDKIRRDFQARDRKLASAPGFDKVIIWVEHDLYDQLQLIQLLDWFTANKCDNLYLINPAKHLGYHTPEEAQALLATEKKVTEEMLALGTKAWNAYRQPTPVKWRAVLDMDTSVLPFLDSAIRRSLMELPDINSGLNHTEHTMLEHVEKGITDRVQLFRTATQQEEAAFHGDMGFFWYLDQLLADAPHLVEESNGHLSTTNEGKRVLNDNQRWQRQYGHQHWIGGHQIHHSDNYYWDPKLLLTKAG